MRTVIGVCMLHGPRGALVPGAGCVSTARPLQPQCGVTSELRRASRRSWATSVCTSQRAPPRGAGVPGLVVTTRGAGVPCMGPSRAA